MKNLTTLSPFPEELMRYFECDLLHEKKRIYDEKTMKIIEFCEICNKERKDEK